MYPPGLELCCAGRTWMKASGVCSTVSARTDGVDCWPELSDAHFPHDLFLFLLELQLGLLDGIFLAAVILPADHALDLCQGLAEECTQDSEVNGISGHVPLRI